MVDVGAIGRHAEGVQAGALRREVLFVGGDAVEPPRVVPTVAVAVDDGRAVTVGSFEFTYQSSLKGNQPR